MGGYVRQPRQAVGWVHHQTDATSVMSTLKLLDDGNVALSIGNTEGLNSPSSLEEMETDRSRSIRGGNGCTTM